MKILAIDIGTKCGWAYSNGKHGRMGGYSGTWDLSVKRDESAGMRLIRLYGKLREVHESQGLDLIVFEAIRYAGPRMGGSMVVMAEMQGVIKQFCEEHGVPYRGVSSTEIKKHATGKGNSNKAAMKVAAIVKWGQVRLEDCDDNEIDAMWILDFARHLYG